MPRVPLPRGPFRKSRDQRTVKDIGRVSAAQSFPRKMQDEGPEIEHPVPDCIAVAETARRPDQGLELHRRLPFVALDETNGCYRRCGIEEPAEAGCPGRLHTAFEHRRELHNTPMTWPELRREINASGLLQGCHPHAPRLTRRAVATGQRQRCKRSRSAPMIPVGDEHFAPQLVPSAPKPWPSSASPRTGPESRYSATTAATWAT